MFDLPEDLTILTKKALTDFALQAAAARDEIKNTTTRETVTDEQLEELEQLKQFNLDVETELSNRAARQARFDAATAEDAEPEDEPEDEPPAETPTEAPAAATKEPETVTASGRAPSMAEIVGNTAAGGQSEIPTESAPKNYTFIAAPDSGFAAGSELEGWDDVTKAFINRSRSHLKGAPTQSNQFASIKREFGEYDVFESDSDFEQMRKIDLVRDPDDASLLAGVGWCSPSETIYTTCSQVTATGLLSVPEIGARRGGIRHNQGIQFDTIFGTGTGFNILTEAQVVADTAKTCLSVPCPDFVDDRLKVAVLCITGDILQDRTYPEFVKTFIQGAMAVQAHNVNRQIIADIVSDSDAVTLTGGLWTADGTVLSQHMAAIDVAATDIRYRLRLDPNATLEVKLPLWFKPQLRADYLRQNARVSDDLADAVVMRMYSDRNVAVQWVYDWQDAFSVGASAGYPGADTPIQALPQEVSFLIYPAGTWVVARQDVIRLTSIYDSTNITTNKVTQLFLEDGFKAMRFCPLSRVYTHAICPNGDTGAQRSIDC